MEASMNQSIPGVQTGANAPASTAYYPKSVDWAMDLSGRPLTELLDDAARDFPAKAAIVFKGKTTTYRELAEAVGRTAAGLQKIGVTKSTKVGLLLPNTPTFIIYYFAILKAGGTVVNFNPLYTIEELTFQARDSDTRIMITHDLKALFGKVETLVANGVLQQAVVVPFAPLLPIATELLFKIFKRKEIADIAHSPVVAKVTMGPEIERSGATLKSVAIAPDTDVAVLQYTGGTTGTPKGAMLTHTNLYVNAAQINAWATDLKHGEERVLGALPLFHVFAMTVVMNMAIAKAATIILMPRFQLDEALGLIHKEKPTMMPAVPTIFTAMLNHPKLKSFDMSSMKFCISGGAPLPLEIKLQFEELTGSSVVEGYGLSEASPVVTCNPMDGPVVSGSIGLPLPQTSISLRDLSDPSREVPAGERGELCVKGPQVMKGYWNRPKETADQFNGEFLRTGDVAVMDEKGFYFIVDRIKDLIICSGFNVYPRRIEEAIYEHPAVEEVTVIGIKDSYRGEAPKAFIKLKSGMSATVADIFKHLEPKISKIEMPSQIEFRDSLPKTLIGKLSKKELVAEEAKKRA
ncbi:MAG: long-chain fatty acid--CoA ligase [Hyphomicrobium sp.]|nr:long-chain fatty acid--CoA ligase [Hyphomicrobium sp.]